MRTIRLLLHIFVGMIQYFLHQIAQGIRFVNYMFYRSSDTNPRLDAYARAVIIFSFNLISIGEIVLRIFIKLRGGVEFFFIIYFLTAIIANHFIVYHKRNYFEFFEEFRKRYTPIKHRVFFGIYVVFSVALFGLIAHLVDIGHIKI